MKPPAPPENPEDLMVVPPPPEDPAMLQFSGDVPPPPDDPYELAPIGTGIVETVKNALAETISQAQQAVAPLQQAASGLSAGTQEFVEGPGQEKIPIAAKINELIDAAQSGLVEKPQELISKAQLPPIIESVARKAAFSVTAPIALAGELLKVPETVNEVLMTAAAMVTIPAAQKLLPKVFPILGKEVSMPGFLSRAMKAEGAAVTKAPSIPLKKPHPTQRNVHDLIKREANMLNREKQLLTNFKKRLPPQPSEGQFMELELKNIGILKRERTLFELRIRAGKKTVPLSEPQAVFSEFRKTNGIRLIHVEAGTSVLPRRKPKVGFKQKNALLSPQEISGEIEQALNLPIRQGKFRQRARGIAKIGPEVIRISARKGGDIETVFHETGHILNKRIFNPSGAKGLSTKSFKPFADELLPIATEKGKLTEGFAEFTRLYVANEDEARRVAPKFYEFFEKKMENHPETGQMLLKARDDFNRYMNAPATSRILARISQADKGMLDGKAVKETFKSLYTQLVDDLAPIRRVVKELAGEDVLAISDDPGKLAQLFRGWTGKAEAFLKHKTIKYGDLSQKGPGLKDIIGPIESKLDDFRVYMVSRRAHELHGRNIQTGLFRDDVTASLKELNSPEFEAAFNGLQQWNDDLLTYLVDSGMMSGETFIAIKEMNKSYVPFYRIVEDAAAGGTGKKVGNLFSPVKRIKGADLDIIDPLESLVKNAYAYINIAERNRVAQAIGNLSKLEGAGKFVEAIPAPMKGAKVAVSEIQGQLEKMGIEIDGEMAEKVLSIFRPGSFSPAENIISVMTNGKPQYFELEPEFFKAAMNMNVESFGFLGKLLSFPAKMLRAGAVLSPEFMLRNPFKDQTAAFVHSRYGYFPPVDFPRGVFHVLNNDDMYWKWKVSGGENSTLVSMDRAYLNKNFSDVMRENNIPVTELIKDPVKMAKTIAKYIPHVITSPIETLRLLSSISEETTRLGEFVKALKAQKGQTARGAMEEAGLASRDVTLDFNVAGSKGRAINMIVAFWNAQVRSMDQIVKSAKRDPMGVAAKIFAAITLPELALYWATKDDPRMDEIPSWQKDLFYVIPTGSMDRERWDKMSPDQKQEFNAENPIWRLPGAYELKVVFGAFPRRMIDYMRKEMDPVAFEGMGQSMMDSFALGIIPTAAKPIIDNYANWNSFLGRAIVPHQNEDLEPFMQKGNRTSELAQKIGGVIGYSPAKIDNLIYGYTGGLGGYAVKAIDELMRQVGFSDPLPNITPTRSDMAIIKGFSVRFPSPGTASIQRFYNNLTDSRVKTRTYKRMLKEGNKKTRSYLEKNKDRITKSSAFENIGKSFSMMHRAASGFLKDENLEPDEKRKAIDAIYFQMIEMAQRANRGLGIGPRYNEETFSKNTEESQVINNYLKGDVEISTSEMNAIFQAMGEEKAKEEEK